MNDKNSTIDGVVIKPLNRYTDIRGWLTELYRSDEAGDYIPAMAYISVTNPGEIRGPHEHIEQTDLFYFVGSSTFEIRLWDNRELSKTYGGEMVIVADIDNPLSVLVPPGVVHGYRNMDSKESPQQHGLVINFPDKLHAGKNRAEAIDEIRHESDKNSPFKFPGER